MKKKKKKSFLIIYYLTPLHFFHCASRINCNGILDRINFSEIIKPRRKIFNNFVLLCIYLSFEKFLYHLRPVPFFSAWAASPFFSARAAFPFFSARAASPPPAGGLSFLQPARRPVSGRDAPGYIVLTKNRDKKWRKVSLIIP